MVCENIPISMLSEFEKFLKENQILADVTTFLVPVPTKNTKMFQELQNFADKNNFEIKIDDTGCMIIDIPIVVSDSPEFEKLLRKLEEELHKELRNDI